MLPQDIDTGKKHVIVKVLMMKILFLSERQVNSQFPFNDVHLNQLSIGHAISREEITDLNKLLPKIYDDNWADEEPLADERLKWFKNFIFDEPTTEAEYREEECDCLDEETLDLHI